MTFASATFRAAAAAVLAGSLAASLAAPADAQRQSQAQRTAEEERLAEQRVFSAPIGEIVLAAQTQQEEDNWAGSVTTLNRALERPNISPYERSVVLQLRGRARYEMGQVMAAVQDWQDAIGTGMLLTNEIVNLRINIGQLLIVEGRYDEGIRNILQAVEAGGQLTDRLAMLLAQAYAQADRFQEGLRYAEMAYDMASPKERRHFNLVLAYYQRLEMLPQQLRIVREMVERWPNERQLWASYSSILANTDREADAFEANKVMYLNGLLTEGRELVRLAQYYSFFEFPYRGAVIMEREMNAGRIERTRDNLNALANMWRQAREFRRALPILRQLAEASGSGDDWGRVAEAHYQLNQLPEAEAAFVRALNAGGLRQTGETWALLGTVRYERRNRQGALEAFARARQFPSTQRSASGWYNFIRAELDGEVNRRILREQVRQDECSFTVQDARDTAVITGDVDEEGRVRITIPQNCRDLYDPYGVAIPGAAEEATRRVAAAARGAQQEDTGGQQEG
ncbi:MAG: hypothetical protein KIS81_09995 [Maricaulaceae bacterium]|nr:hypothetical protein [Maricaulaceae bacterium]